MHNRYSVGEFNQEAAERIQADRSAILQRRIGNVLHCVNRRETPGGCGFSESCRECTIRRSVDKAYEGWTTRRSPTSVRLDVQGGLNEIRFDVSASLFRLEERNLVLLTIEEIT